MEEEKKTILIVDDSVYLINKLKTIFKRNGFEAVGITNGMEAIKQYSILHPVLVTMDIVMPDINGLEVIEKLKRIDPEVKVIVISSIGMKEKIMAAVKLGAKNFILKPFSEQKVMEIVNRVLGVKM